MEFEIGKGREEGLSVCVSSMLMEVWSCWLLSDTVQEGPGVLLEIIKQQQIFHVQITSNNMWMRDGQCCKGVLCKIIYTNI